MINFVRLLLYIVMLKSKLVSVLKRLGKKERGQFKKFVRSPFHNRHQHIINMNEYLLGLAPEWKAAYLDKEAVFKHIFPEETIYDDLKMRHLMSGLFQLVEEFLMWNHFKSDKTLNKINLMSAYRKKGLNKLFLSILKKINKELAQEKPYYPTFFFHHFLTHSEYNQYLESLFQRGTEPNLQNLSDSLDSFYLANKLKCCCAMLSYQNLVNIEYQLHLSNELIHYLSKHWTNYEAPVAIYYHTLLTLIEPDKPEHFQQLKQLLQKHYARFPKSELQDIYAFAKNYCIKHLNKGQVEFLQELFELYQTEIEQELILINDFFPPNDFKNIVSVGLRLKEYQWVETFIKENEKKLNDAFRKNVYAYNLAQLRFEQGRYKEVLELLHRLNYDELFLGLDARRLLLKTYYELGEEEALESLIDSFKAFIRRHKSIAYHKDIYINLIRFTQKLVQVNIFDKTKIKGILQDIEQHPAIVDKTWLLEKVRELL